VIIFPTAAPHVRNVSDAGIKHCPNPLARSPNRLIDSV